MIMKKIFIAAAAALTTIVACQKNELAAPAADSVLYATIEETDATKTYMDASNNILWSEGDQIVAFMKTSLGLQYQVTSSSVGKASARFEEVGSNGGGLNAGTEWNHNVAYYPYSEKAECLKSGNNYNLDVVLPSEQTYVSESFGNGSMAMVAVSENNNITFRNVLGGMKLQLRGTQKVKSITLEGKNNEKLSGAATVTAYAGETKPAITMSQTASTSVTLNCGSGVQLNESSATDFIIALPPVLFSSGFTVTVTDMESNTYTVETDKTNTVIRSSLLVMPAFKLGEVPEQGVPDGILVTTIFIDRTSLIMVPNVSYTFETDVDPYNATDKTLVWNSSNPAVASVAADGTVTALSDGSSTITAVAVGGAAATCSVTVKSCVSATVDYEVDGINYGKGVRIGTTIWAPVNCGYHNTDYPYGKLYQWGRKYGQGYDSSDASYPSGENLVEGPVMPSVGQAEENKDKFYYVSSSPYDWSKVQNDQLWNSGTESSPVKTAYDPCPEGWRVPTYAELDQLRRNRSSWTTSESQKGCYFSGEYTTIDGNPQVFFPAADERSFSDGNADYRGNFGYYWSSRPNSSYAYYLFFDSSYADMGYYSRRASGQSVRCVQATD